MKAASWFAQWSLRIGLTAVATIALSLQASGAPLVIEIYGPSSAPSLTPPPKGAAKRTTPSPTPTVMIPRGSACADAVASQVVLAVCRQVEMNAGGFMPHIATSLGDWFSGNMHMVITANANGTYSIDSRSLDGEDVGSIDQQSITDVTGWTAQRLGSLLPAIAGGELHFTAPAWTRKTLQVAESAAAPPSMLWTYILIGLLSQRGVYAQPVDGKRSAEMVGSGNCTRGQYYILYNVSTEHSDRTLGLSRDNSRVTMTLFLCGSGAVVSLAGQDSAFYLKNADKTSLIGFLTALLPKSDWGAITPVAALGLAMMNEPDSQTKLTTDSVTRAMQQAVDRFCYRQKKFSCDRHKITDCSHLQPRTETVEEAVGYDPRLQRKNCRNVPAQPTAPPSPSPAPK